MFTGSRGTTPPSWISSTLISSKFSGYPPWNGSLVFLAGKANTPVDIEPDITQTYLSCPIRQRSYMTVTAIWTPDFMNK
jgi:hypothetical protein